MKRLLLLAFATLLTVACRPGDANSKASDNEDVKDSTEVSDNALPVVTESVDDAPTTEERVKARVLDIYTKVFATYSDEATGKEDVKIIREGFLSEHLRLLISACETIQEETGDLIFSCDHWINAQDYEDLQLKGARVLSCTDEQAEAEVRFCNFGKEQVLFLVLVYDEKTQDWFIDDFLDEDKLSFRHYLEHLL